MERHKPMTHDALKLARAALDDDSEGDSDLSPLCRSIVNGEHRDVRSRDDRSERVDEIAEIKSRLSKLEAAAKRKPSRRKMEKADMELFADAIGNVLGEAIEPLMQRIEKLEQRSELKWAGVWSAGMRCAEGELITDRGSLWICTAPSSDRPGDNASAFRLIVKNGHATDGTRRHATTGVKS